MSEPVTIPVTFVAIYPGRRHQSKQAGGAQVKKSRIKIPGQSWSIKEKLDVVNALCADRRFSHGEARAAVTMVLYFHNTASGHLFPSREQVSEQCGVSKNIIISGTKKMERFGYLRYDKTSGGRNERNTYHLNKLTPKVVNLETVQKLNGIENETVQNLNRGGSETEHAGVQKLNTHIPLEIYLL